MSNYTELTYQDLRKLASTRGIESGGSKEDLIARLEAADGMAQPAGAAPTSMSEQPAAKPVNLDRHYKTRAMEMKAKLDAQPRVRIFIPFDAGENPVQAAKLPQIVNIRGYQFTIPRGQYVEVPEQVANMIQERLESENKAGRQFLVETDPQRAEALS